MDAERKSIIRVLEHKEAVASVALDNDPDMETMVAGTSSNQKLFHIGIEIVNKHTDEIIWNGSMADAIRTWRRLKHD